MATGGVLLLVLGAVSLVTAGSSSSSSSEEVLRPILRAASSTSCSCGWANKGRVVGGKETGKNQYPWVAALTDKNKGQFCGGSIVTPHHVLSAGHCIEGRTAGNTFVVVGAHRVKEGKLISVKTLFRHPDYRTVNGILINDIAILVTKDSIPFNQNIGPVCIPSAKIDLSWKKIKAIGWGMTSFNSPGSPVLNEVDLTSLPYSECQRGYQNRLPPQQSQICTQDAGKSTCHGDSGGPLVYLDPAIGRYVLVALTSFGDRCRTPPPAVNTEVAAFLHFINTVIWQTHPELQSCKRL